MNSQRGDSFGPTVFDASDVSTDTGDGVHWTLARSADLNVNLVRLDPGHQIDIHVNDELDVVVIVVAGSGTIAIDDVSSPLFPNVIADVPKGSSRRIDAGSGGLGYFTIHRRRTLGIANRGTGVGRR